MIVNLLSEAGVIAKAIRFLGLCIVRAAAVAKESTSPLSVQEAITITEKEAQQ